MYSPNSVFCYADKQWEQFWHSDYWVWCNFDLCCEVELSYNALWDLFIDGGHAALQGRNSTGSNWTNSVWHNLHLHHPAQLIWEEWLWKLHLHCYYPTTANFNVHHWEWNIAVWFNQHQSWYDADWLQCNIVSYWYNILFSFFSSSRCPSHSVWFLCPSGGQLESSIWWS